METAYVVREEDDYNTAIYLKHFATENEANYYAVDYIKETGKMAIVNMETFEYCPDIRIYV